MTSMPEPGTTCSFCRSDLGTSGALAASETPPDVLLVVLANNPGWRVEDGLCRECARRFEEAVKHARAHYPAFAQVGVPILPTPVRLFASDAFTGRGVTIA